MGIGAVAICFAEGGSRMPRSGGAGCLATWPLVRGGVALAGAPLNFHWLGAAALIGAGRMLLLIGLGSRIEIMGLAALMG